VLRVFEWYYQALLGRYVGCFVASCGRLVVVQYVKERFGACWNLVARRKQSDQVCRAEALNRSCFSISVTKLRHRADLMSVIVRYCPLLSVIVRYCPLLAK